MAGLVPATQPPLLPDMVEADVLWLSAGAAAPAIGLRGFVSLARLAAGHGGGLGTSCLL